MNYIVRLKEAYKRSHYYWKQVIKTPKPRVLYVGGWLGQNNLGDEALFEAYKKLFHRFNFVHYPSPVGCVLSIPSKLLNVADLAILAGGTLINRGGYLHVTQECIDIVPKFYTFGTGVATPAFWSGRPGWKDTLKQWKPILEKCDYIGVRGPMSAKVLEDIPVSNVEIIGDPVLVFADETLASEKTVIPNSVGFNIGASRGNIWGSEASMQAEFIKLAKLARDAGWIVRWFVVWPKDLQITKQTARASGTADEIYEIYTDPMKYLQLVRPMSTFVGLKLHAVALATCAYVPSVMLEYRPKCRDYMQTIGQDTATVRTDQFQADEVWEMIRSWNSQRPEISNLLYNSIKPVRDKQCQKADELMRVLGNTNG